MLCKRLIACLDVRDGRVVKGTNFRALRDAGDPAELAARYDAEGIDEVVVLDVSATVENRRARGDDRSRRVAPVHTADRGRRRELAR